uniref:Ig-like domain-containing protein n=1 Tax=Terrapene triunguis TaxID=2587831 RepID=A0A674IIZ8_9SAUR
ADNKTRTYAGLTQTPNLILATGQTAHLRCEQTDEHYIMYWYWLQQRKGLQLIYFSVINSVHPCGFCNSPASLCNNREQYFGDGTRLTVLEVGLNITSPRVAIFPPSKQEIKEKGKATLVCLATKFYPDHIKLFWEVNDAEREDGVRTDEFSTWDETSKSYSLTSRLRISTQEWFNSKNSFRCAVKFHLDEIQRKTVFICKCAGSWTHIYAYM